MPTPGATPYREFRQAVRRYRLSELLHGIAHYAVILRTATARGEQRPAWPRSVQEFSLAGVARTALASGTEHRDRGPSEAELFRLCAMYVNVDDPHANEQMPDGVDTMRYMLTRVAYEQLSFQYSPFENIARAPILLLDRLGAVPGAPTASEWTDLLGVPLPQFMRVGFALFSAIQSNGGAIDREVLLAPHVEPIFAPLTSHEALRVIDEHFAASPDRLKEMANEAEIPGFEKWSPNPLEARPAVRLGDRYVSPAPAHIVEKITPAGLYYTGSAQFGSRFTNALGAAFEQYVGGQLRLLERATVLPEITYDNDQHKTVDWFVITEELVVLVEAKSSRPVVGTRIGDPDADGDLARKIGHACGQIARTVDLVRADDPAVAAIPKDRPMRGIVVTLAPFHMLGTFDDGIVQSPRDVPITLASAHDLESTVGRIGHRDDLGERLLAALTPAPTEPADLRQAAVGTDRRRNPILEAGWERFTDGLPDDT